ncbi:MAG: hypothetical protein AB7H48_09765 [Parachlamydiales bacterium]
MGCFEVQSILFWFSHFQADPLHFALYKSGVIDAASCPQDLNKLSYEAKTSHEMIHFFQLFDHGNHLMQCNLRMETIDVLVDMFLRRMRRTENAAREELRLIQDKHCDWEESLISVLEEVLDHTTEEEDATFGKQVRKILNDKGGVDALKGIYDKVSAYHHNNYLSLLWPIHSKYRAVLFQLFDLIELVSATQDQYLIQAFEFVKKYRHTHREYLPLEIDLSFMSQRWF